MSIARPDRAFLLVAAAGALAYLSLPRDTALYNRWFQLFAIAAVLATLVGIALHRPRAPAAWYLVALSWLGAVAADAVHAVYAERSPVVPFPSEADVLALVSDLVLVAALLCMVRRQAPGRDRASLIDAAIIALGVGVVGWSVLVQPHLETEASPAQLLAALAFPVLDVLVLSIAARMVLGPGLRSPAFAMVTTALVFQLVGDALYGFGSLHSWYEPGDPLDLLFVLSAVLWGTAALHPSMVDLTEPAPEPETRVSIRRLWLLAAATLAAPAMLALAVLRAGQAGLLVVVGGSAAVSALVMARLAGLVARHERGERREQALREAAAALAAAWTRTDIHQVAVDAAVEIVGGESVTAGLSLGGPDDFRIVAATGERSRQLLALGPGDLDPAAAAALRERAPGAPRTVTTASRAAHWTLVRLTLQGDLRGALVVRTSEPLSRYTRDGLETLAAQVALALEGVALAESVHERQSAERFRSLVQNSSDVILLLADDLTVRYHTPSVGPVLGYGEDELVGRSLADLVERSEAERLRAFFEGVRAAPAQPLPRDLLLCRRDGSVCRLESVFNNLLHDENVAGVVVTARDVTERRALEEQLAHQAFHDSLTGLANRALFADRVTHALERSRRRPFLVAALLIDLDDFKTVNDSLGHAAGDELLVGIARRLEGCLRPEDTCVRLGGDEFAVLLEEVPDVEAALAVAGRVAEAISRPVTVLGSEVAVQASIGVAFGAPGQTADELLRSADLAMYRAKEGEGARIALYEPSMHERVLERLALKADLRRALEADEFELHYQPIVALGTGETAAVEALVRWRHPERGLVLPDTFVPLAEEMGLILPLGDAVLRGACRQARAWRDHGHPALGVSVNISAKQLGGAGLPDEVAAALAEASLPPDALTLEITESVLLDSEAVIARLAALRELGVRIAIDDFGTGYSSLDYLRRFPVDALKIAKPFVAGLGAGAAQQRLVSAILRLGSTLGLDTVAEGIEDASQRDRLCRLGCRHGQGHFFSFPLLPEELEPLLRGTLAA